ncbi:uncharacterized protein ACMZJ9_009884 [Mantella aurantiaca]
MGCLDHVVVGIFSREDSTTYEWLTRIITSTWGVKDVRPVLITNNRADLQENIPKCNTAILYHSKSRGRLNITDVTDSLYDEELETLFNKYGRENVIVVVGDMENSSDEQKALMLREQPSLARYARDLFLFNEIKGDRAPFQGPKIKDLKGCIKKIAGRKLYKRFLILLTFLSVVLIIIIIAVIVCTTQHPENPSTLSPPVTNATSHFISNITTIPPSTIAKITSTVTSQTINALTQLLENATKQP